jgi:tetratricopeptide (TPR) repeat protein
MIGREAHAQKSGRRRSLRRMTLLGIVAAVLLVACALLMAGCSDKGAAAQKAELDGDLATAETLYKEQVQAHPSDITAVKGLAGILYLERKWDEVLPFQEKAVALDPKEAQIRVELGFNYLNHQHQAAKAVAVFREASLLRPTAQYLTFLAQALSATGDQKAAEETLRKAMVTDTTYAHAYSMLIEILAQQGRTAEAADVRASAAGAGVTLEPSATAP